METLNKEPKLTKKKKDILILKPKCQFFNASLHLPWDKSQNLRLLFSFNKTEVMHLIQTTACVKCTKHQINI